MKYSIIVPHKNDYDNLRILLKSIPERKDVEVLIIDDHSNTEIFQKLQEKFSKIKNVCVYSSPGSGAGTARNFGVEKSVGDWLLFADSDDVFITESFSNLDKNCLEIYDVIYFTPLVSGMVSNDYRVHYQDMFKQYFLYPTSRKKWNIRLNFDVPWSKVVKKSFIERKKISFDNTKKQNDTIFSQKVGIFAKNILIVDKPIYKAINNKKSISHKNSRELFDDVIGVRIRSYNLKKKCFSKKFLKENDISFFQSPLRSFLYSVRDFHDLKYSISIYERFRREGIPVFTILSVYYLLKEKI